MEDQSTETTRLTSCCREGAVLYVMDGVVRVRVDLVLGERKALHVQFIWILMLCV